MTKTIKAMVVVAITGVAVTIGFMVGSKEAIAPMTNISYAVSDKAIEAKETGVTESLSNNTYPEWNFDESNDENKVIARVSFHEKNGVAYVMFSSNEYEDYYLIHAVNAQENTYQNGTYVLVDTVTEATRPLVNQDLGTIEFANDVPKDANERAKDFTFFFKAQHGEQL